MLYNDVEPIRPDEFPQPNPDIQPVHEPDTPGDPGRIPEVPPSEEPYIPGQPDEIPTEPER